MEPEDSALIPPKFLNLGCGNRHDADPLWLHHDLVDHHRDIRVHFDLEDVTGESRICWNRSSFYLSHDNLGCANPLVFEKVVLRDVLEHISPHRFMGVMGFVWNATAPGGFLEIQVPQWGSENAVVDPTHYRGFHLNSMDFLDPSTGHGARNQFYGCGTWEILEKEVVPRSKVNLRFLLCKPTK
jgi:hypothetical protein